MSTYVVYGAPPVLPEPPLPIWQGLTHTWTGWDGTTFNLSTGEQGVHMLLDGVTGMHLPEFEQFVDEHASVDGGRYRGSRTKVRQPSWTIGIFGDASKMWRDRDVAFWKTLDPERPGMWTVADPDGRTRSLLCRLRPSSEHPYSIDPHEAGWSVYSVDLLAEQPYWTSQPVTSPLWQHVEGVPFTGPDDEAPPFHVSKPSTIGTASLTNDADIEAHLVHVATGPITSLSVEAAGGVVEYGAIADGSVLRINTDPTYPIATLDGVDVTGDVDPWDPRPIPAYETTDVTITLVGAGSLQSSFTPRHRRAL